MMHRWTKEQTHTWAHNDPRWSEVAHDNELELKELKADKAQQNAAEERAALLAEIRAEVEQTFEAQYKPVSGFQYPSMAKQEKKEDAVPPENRSTFEYPSMKKN